MMPKKATSEPEREPTFAEKKLYIQKTAKSTTMVLIIAAVLIMFLRRKNDFSTVIDIALLIVAILDLLLIFPIQKVMHRRLQALEQEQKDHDTAPEETG